MHETLGRWGKVSQAEKRAPPSCGQVSWPTYHHSRHIALLSGPLPFVHLEVSEDVEKWVFPHWGNMEA